MSELLRAILTGAIAGGIYSLIGVGLVVTYSVTGIFDLAYGGLAFVSALLFYELNTGLGWNRFLCAAVIIFGFAPLMGLALERFVYRRLPGTDEAVKLVTSVGLLVALPATALFVVEKGNSWLGWHLASATNVPAAPGLIFQPSRSYKISEGLIVNSNELAVAVAGIIAGVGLWLLYRSRFGLNIKAVRDRETLAVLRGVNKTQVVRRTAVLGSVLASLAGVLGAPILSQLDSRIFTLALFVAAAAVVFGRFNSVPMTYAGGILLGILINLTYRYVHVSQVPQLSQAVPFILLLVGLLLLAHNRSRLAGVTGTVLNSPNWRGDLSLSRRLLPSAVPLLVFLGLAYFVFADFWLSLTVRSLAVAVILLSITVVTGLGGMVSLAQATFSISSALTVGLLVNNYGWPLFPAMCVGVAVAVLLGVIVALPSLRLGGVPLTLATLALALIGQSLILGWSYLTNNSTGWLVDRPVIGSFNLGDDKNLLLVMCAVLLALTWLICNVNRSASGRAILALRASEPAATSVGLSAVAARLRLVCLSAAIAGLGGVLLLIVDQGVSSGSGSALDGLTWVTIMVVLGARRPLSAVVGGLSLVLIPALISSGFTAPLGLFTWGGTDSAYIPAMLFGLAVLDLMRNPDGALERFSRYRYRKRNGPVEHIPASIPNQSMEPADEVRVDADVAVPVGKSAAVDLTDVRSGYGLVQVLHGIDASFPQGSISVVLGANGAGKSTLLNTMVGLLPSTSGTIQVRTTTAAQGPMRGITLVPEGRGIFPGLTVQDNLRLSLHEQADVQEAYRRFPSLAERRNVPAGSLSGGEQQMLALAPMLIIKPAVLLVDEPTLGLAPQIAAQVLQMLVECRDAGSTVIVADEKQAINSSIGEHVVLLALGHVLWEGASDQLPPDALAAAYGMDHTAEQEDLRRDQLDEQMASLFMAAPG